MDETAWLNATDPTPMLRFLRETDKASERKLRRFAVACCRRIWPHLMDRRSQNVVQVSELYADGLATRRQLHRAWQRADAAAEAVRWSGGGDVDQNPSQAVACLGLELHVTEAAELAAATFGAVARGDAYDHIWRTPDKDNDARWAEDDAIRRAATAEEEHVQATLLRDIVANPFRPPQGLPHAVSAWNDGTVVRIAQVVYGEAAFGRLPLLADALLDAGCDCDEILEHLRGPGPHAKGCHVLDLLLGKE